MTDTTINPRTTKPRPATREEWLAPRRPRIGASEIAALFGRHPFLTAGQLYQSRMNPDTTEPMSPAMRRGLLFEAAVAELAGEVLGVELHEPDVIHFYGDDLVATIDRFTPDGTIVEIKTVRGAPAVPHPHWIDQVQQQMLCADAADAHVAVFDLLTDRLDLHHITADPAHQERLVHAAEDFLAAMDRGLIPDAVALEYESQRHTEVRTDRAELDDDTLSTVRLLASVTRRIRNLEEDAGALKGMIGRVVGDAAEGWHGDEKLVTFRATTRTTIDAARLRKDHPDVFDEYHQTTTYRSLRLVERKP